MDYTIYRPTKEEDGIYINAYDDASNYEIMKERYSDYIVEDMFERYDFSNIISDDCEDKESTSDLINRISTLEEVKSVDEKVPFKYVYNDFIEEDDGEETFSINGDIFDYVNIEDEDYTVDDFTLVKRPGIKVKKIISKTLFDDNLYEDMMSREHIFGEYFFAFDYEALEELTGYIEEDNDDYEKVQALLDNYRDGDIICIKVEC